MKHELVQDADRIVQTNVQEEHDEGDGSTRGHLHALSLLSLLSFSFRVLRYDFYLGYQLCLCEILQVLRVYDLFGHKELYN